jgi:hypothetical protein
MAEETAQAQTLFVGGLPQDCTMEEVKAYFVQYGEVDVDIKFDQQTGRSRGFGFLAFQDPMSVQPCIDNASNHQIRDKWVDVKIYSKGGGKGGGKDKGKGKGFGAPKGGKGKGPPAYGGGGYGGGGYAGYGKGGQSFGGYDQYGGGGAAAYGGAAAGGYAGYGQQQAYAAQPQYAQQQAYAGYGQQQMRYSPY